MARDDKAIGGLPPERVRMLPVMQGLVVRTLLFTVIAPGLVTVGVPTLILVTGAELHHIDRGFVRWVGAALLAVGVAIYLWCAWSFVRTGRGTPAPWDAPRLLVIRGLYRVSRNPMYVGIVSIVVGEAVWFGSASLLLWAGIVLVAFHLSAVLYEEPRLVTQFGEEYRAYRQRVRRWF